LQEITKGVRGNFVTQLRPLFPGYIFVAFDIAEVGWRRVKSTHGITQLVSFGTQPTPVPLDLISQLMLRCDHEGKLLPPKLLRLNDQVMLNTGPFADYVGTIEAIAPDRRIWVLMEIMGRQTRVSVTAASVRAACH
jgi:transcriptional antiterminator RfaH